MWEEKSWTLSLDFTEIHSADNVLHGVEEAGVLLALLLHHHAVQPGHELVHRLEGQWLVISWQLNSSEGRHDHLPQHVELLLQPRVVLPLLHRLHLQLADCELHAVDVFPQHSILLLKLCRLFPELPELQLPGLVVVKELLGKNRNVKAVAVLSLRLGHHHLPVTLVEAIPLAVPGQAGPSCLLLLLDPLLPSATTTLPLRLQVVFITVSVLVVRELLVIPVLVPLGQVVVLVLLWLCQSAPLCSKLLAEVTEGDVRVLPPHTLPPLVKKVDIATQRLLGGSYTLGVSPLALGPPSVLGLDGLVRGAVAHVALLAHNLL